MPKSTNRTFAGYGLLLCAQLLAALVFVVLSRAGSGRPSNTRELSCRTEKVRKKLTIVFVDSLSERVARDARLMPELGALARRGVAFEISPCRDQLTYLCLRALLTGYDESTLLALRGNFTHAPSSGDNLLERAREAGLRLVVVGSRDFEAYGTALYRSRFRDGGGPSEALIFDDLSQIDAERRADVTLLSLSSGDQAAHGHGTHSAEYEQAFRAIDRLIGRVVAEAGPDSDLLVFGDHGHDEMGRHLPGLPSTTFAVYAGPSFRAGVELKATLTDHRAILGALLGVPSPPSYTGPDFERIFAVGAFSLKELAELAKLRAPPARAEHRGTLWVLAWATLVAALAVAQRALRRCGLSALCSTAWALFGALAMAWSGANYDALRHKIHDHGSEPQRSFWLLVPLGLGLMFALTRSPPPPRPRAAWLEACALATLLIGFTLTFPNAYYYGTTRVTLLAAIVGLGLRLLGRWYTIAGSSRVLVSAQFGTSALLLGSLYGLRDVGGRTREMAYFVCSSPLFAGYAMFTLGIVKFGLWSWFAYAAQRSRRDLALALLVLIFDLWLAHKGASSGRVVLGFAVCAYLALQLFQSSRYVATRFFCGLLAAGQFYGEDALRLAPMQVLLLCVALLLAAHRLLFGEDRRTVAAATGITLAVAFYLMLWPTLGMRFSGVDFRFMFAWVPLARYEELWWLIGLGTLLKFVWPYALLLDVARRSCPREARAWACQVLSLKLGALSVFAAWYATRHALLSNGALEILAELSLLLLVSALAWPLPVRAGLQRAPSQPGADAHRAARSLTARPLRAISPIYKQLSDFDNLKGSHDPCSGQVHEPDSTGSPFCSS